MHVVAHFIMHVYVYVFLTVFFLIATEAMEASPPSEAIDCMHVCTCIHACMGSKACMYEVVSPGADGQSVACSSVKLHAPSCTCMNCMHRPLSLHQWKRLVPRTGYHACKIKSRSHSCMHMFVDLQDVPPLPVSHKPIPPVKTKPV